MEENKTIYNSLQNVRLKLSQTELKKSGYNGFAKFNYFELKDFLPTATKLFAEEGLCPLFTFEYIDGIEYAILTINNDYGSIAFKSPTAEPNGNNPIQNLGAKHTYMRRYLYLMALDLVENDIVDAQDPKANDTKVYATPLQVETIYVGRDKLADALKERNIKTKNDIKALTIEEASVLCEMLNEN